MWKIMKAMKIVTGIVTAVGMMVLMIPQYYASVSDASVSEAEERFDHISSASESSRYYPAEEPEVSDEIILVDLPMIHESGSSPFDFIMDPQSLICQTNAVRYGGKSFEEGATLYFKNTDKDCDYSNQSDWIEVISRSTVPIKVTIGAVVENLSDIELVEDNTFEEGDETASVYLALIDDCGNKIPLCVDNSAAVEIEMAASEDDSFEVYSFGLTGACNPDGNWAEIDEIPQVILTWTIESIFERSEDAVFVNEQNAGDEEISGTDDADGGSDLVPLQ